MDNQDNDIKLSKAHTLDAPADFVKRSDSISYFNTLKHSSRSSRYSAYVRTHAEQSHAAKMFVLRMRCYSTKNYQVSPNQTIEAKTGKKLQL